MTCAMRGLMNQSFGPGLGSGAAKRKSSYVPGIVVKNLKGTRLHLSI